MFRRSLPLSILAGLCAVACARVDRIDVPQKPLTFVEAGAHETARAAAVDQHGKPMADVKFQFASSDAHVATVDATGLVTAVSSGSATIEVSAQGKKAAIPVDVRIPAKLVVAPVALVGVGTRAQLAAKVEDDAGRTIDGASIAYAVADTAIATLNGRELTASAVGSTRLTATSGALHAEAPLTVTMPGFDHIELGPPEVKVNVGAVAFLEAAVKDAAGAGVNGVTLRFSSSDDKIATVDLGGKIKGVAPGSATITASAGDKTATLHVTVGG